MILSVSRRTDIPAFFSDWFMNRLREQYAYVRNPHSKLISKVPITPENVDCIVFWTKDAEKIIKHLDEIDSMGYKYYFQFTITPYERDIECRLRDKNKIIETFKKLSEKIGKEKVIFRYDPIIMTEKYTYEYHIKEFEKFCGILHSYTERVVISFLDEYDKISKNMREFNMRMLTPFEMDKIADEFSKITKKYDLSLETCAEKIDLSKYNIKHSKCIDGELIEHILGCNLIEKKLDGNRGDTGCGCMKCIDIGEYDSCTHECLYCYANINKEKAKENFKKHDKNSPRLLGSLEDIKDIEPKQRKEEDTRSLKIESLIKELKEKVKKLNKSENNLKALQERLNTLEKEIPTKESDDFKKLYKEEDTKRLKIESIIQELKDIENKLKKIEKEKENNNSPKLEYTTNIEELTKYNE